MMRYQRLSPDLLPPSNGRKQNLRICKEDDAESNGRIPIYSPFVEVKPLRPRSASGSANASPSRDHHHHHFAHFSAPSDPENQPRAQSHHEINGGACSSGGGGNILPQWGHNKRSRGSRAESRPPSDEPLGHFRPSIKIQRRAAAAAMPPPSSYTRGANLRPCTPVRDSTLSLLNRGVEERSCGHVRPEKRSPPSQPRKSAADASVVEGKQQPSDQDPAAEKPSLEQLEWPRIYVSLSRKEKEDDFLLMKGTKLPQRPKKRAKNVDKTLQYCFPGMWLSDLTRGRYEVREKKCVKKKRRGLKGMESMDSDSE